MLPPARLRPAVAFVTLAAFATVLLAACGGDDAPPAAPTSTRPLSPVAHSSPPGPTATTAVSPTRPATAAPTTAPAGTEACPGPDSGVCALAIVIQRALQSGTVDPAVAAFKATEATCVAPNQGIDPAAALCQGRAVGDKVSGYAIGRRASEGALVSRSGLLQFLSKFALAGPVNQRDDYGEWLVRLYTIGTPARPNCATACVTLVYSYIVRATGAEAYSRGIMEFVVEKSGAGWTIASAIDGIILPGELPAILAGGQSEGRAYATWSPGIGTAPATTKQPGPGGPFAFGVVAKVTPGSGAPCAERKAMPSKTFATVDCLAAGVSAVVEAGPVEADGVRWWRVRNTGAGVSAVGWIPAGQLSP